MTCIGCEEYAVRITNLLLDNELKQIFESLTDIIVCIVCNS